jgi:glycosyltransferase involved in cell wall biosynthesis
MGVVFDRTQEAGSPWTAPWRRDEPWQGAARQAEIYLAERVRLTQSDTHVELPRQMAILWEQRADLRRTYDFATPNAYDDYLAWCLTQGIEDGQIAPELIDAAFWAELDAPVCLVKRYNDMPITRALSMFQAARPVNAGASAASVDPQTWLELAVWVLFTAARKYRWAAAMTMSLRAYAEAPMPSLPVYGVPLPRLLLMVWESRADLRVNFDPATEDGRSALLYWFLFMGLEEYGLCRNDLPDYLLRGLFDADNRAVLPAAHRLICRHRPHLPKFDTQTRAGQSAYFRWFEEDGSKEAGIARLFAPRAATPVPGIPRTPAPNRPLILLTGRLNDPSGRGEDIRMTMRALAAQRVPFVTLDRDDGLLRDAAGLVLTDDILPSRIVNIIHLNADSAYSDYQFLRRKGIGGAWQIGYWAWELAKFPTEFFAAFSFVDEVWAATTFASNAFDIGYRPVKLMPMAVEIPRDLAAADRSHYRLPMFRFLFLFNFDFKSYLVRKNPAAVIAAFRRAFPQAREPVTLVIKTINSEDYPADWRKLLNLAGNDRRVILRNCRYTREEMSRLVSLCDCYVSLHRSEGFGRGPAEAMLQGKPVIATNYSGNTDYMRGNNSFPVDYRWVSVGEAEYPGASGQVWAEPDIAHAATQMRRVYEDRNWARRMGLRAKHSMATRYSPKQVGKRYLERLCELEPRLADAVGQADSHLA